MPSRVQGERESRDFSARFTPFFRPRLPSMISQVDGAKTANLFSPNRRVRHGKCKLRKGRGRPLCLPVPVPSLGRPRGAAPTRVADGNYLPPSLVSRPPEIYRGRSLMVPPDGCPRTPSELSVLRHFVSI